MLDNLLVCVIGELKVVKCRAGERGLGREGEIQSLGGAEIVVLTIGRVGQMEKGREI